MNPKDLWIRKDREQYFLSGAIIACVACSVISSYWHFADRLNIKKDIRINKQLSREAEFKQLKETYFTPKLSSGATTYYRMEEPSAGGLMPPPAPGSREEGE